MRGGVGMRRFLVFLSLPIEHVMSVINELTDRVIVLDRGEIIAQGPYFEVSKDKRVIAAYLGEED